MLHAKVFHEYLKVKLRRCYSEHIFFAEEPGRNNLICFKDIASFILGKFKKLKKTQKAKEIISPATKIIKMDITQISRDNLFIHSWMKFKILTMFGNG